MGSAVWSHLDKESRRIRTASLDETIPGFEDITYLEMVTADNLDYINYGEEDMNISYNVKIPEKNTRRKSDEVKALEAFLGMGDVRNMCFECADVDEGKKVAGKLRRYQKSDKHQGVYEIFRVKQSVYVVKAEVKAEPKPTSGIKKGAKRAGNIKAVS